MCWTTGSWKSLLTVSRCSMVPSWQWTRHSRVPSAVMVLPDPGHMENGIALKDAQRDKETTHPELAGRGGRGTACRARRRSQRAGSPLKWHSFSAIWPGPRHRGVSDLLRGRARSAWTRRWSAMLGCAAARAFATSLLDGGASVGVDGPTPLAVVMSETRHLA